MTAGGDRGPGNCGGGGLMVEPGVGLPVTGRPPTYATANRDVRMLVGSGYTPDTGSYALDLVRESGALREALGVAA